MRFLAAASTIAILAAAIYGGWWLYTYAFTRPYTSQYLREQWTEDGTLAALHRWAEQRIGQEKADLRFSSLPPLSGGANLGFVQEFRDDEGKIIAFAVELGGADNHHGIILGEEVTTWWPIQWQWDERTWWYDEVPRTDERSAARVQKR